VFIIFRDVTFKNFVNKLFQKYRTVLIIFMEVTQKNLVSGDSNLGGITVADYSRCTNWTIKTP
jgi:hypothetical protein